MNKLTIKEWAEEDRPREKMLARGITALSDAELVAILISSGNDTETAVQLSQRILLSVKNDLNKLGGLSIEELTRNFRGIGIAKAVTIVAAMELGRRRKSSEYEKKEKITTSRDAWEMFYPLLTDLPHEELWTAFLNRSGKVVHKMKISQGGISGTTADIRLILKSAITNLASGIILCHNHPSGNKLPSSQDDNLTNKLKESARLMEIQLLDHIIIAGDDYYSYGDECRI